ncbi:hypothetical protein [Massilia sp. 9096]|uniref:hypothetical protein n=1 Tax=Massilia sp. 9096 TaxID=1500894 RepID=UPI001EFB3DA5|nr:hypothetical protein [Massilia sp. 9096]
MAMTSINATAGTPWWIASAALGTAATSATVRTVDISEVKMRNRHWQISSKVIMMSSARRVGGAVIIITNGK